MDECDNGARVVILYLGDWDPSGEDMERDLKERLFNEQPELEFELMRVAIHKADIRRFNLPPLRVKDSDTRSGGFVRKYGEDCVELDALPPNELRARLQCAIEDLIEPLAWERARVVEQAQREANLLIATSIKEMVSRSAE